MRTKILLNTALLLALPFLFSCSKEDRYSTSVVTDINLYLDDEEYLLNTGSSDKPLFIYDNNVLLKSFVRMAFLRVNLINGNTKMEYGNKLCIKYLKPSSKFCSPYSFSVYLPSYL